MSNINISKSKDIVQIDKYFNNMNNRLLKCLFVIFAVFVVSVNFESNTDFRLSTLTYLLLIWMFVCVVEYSVYLIILKRIRR
jgi:hypothetical protein